MSDVTAPTLRDQLCFDLYAASRAVTSTYRPVLKELGLTYPQYLVLIVLWEQDTRTVAELADALMLDHGTLTPLLRRLEGHGFVTRRRSSVDERFVEVSLTERGDTVREHASRLHCDMMAAMALDPGDFAALQQTLRALTANVSG